MATSVIIRMYNQLNLGDCFLLKFTNGGKESFMLIDFGSYTKGNDKREIEIAKDIVKTIGKEPIIIVLTHQHKDHLSGFISAKEILSKLNVSEVWFSYLDDLTGKEAATMRDATEKFWKKNSENKKKAKLKFKNVMAVKNMLKAKDSFDFFAEEQTGGEAISNLLEWGKSTPRFLVPGQNFTLPGFSDNSIRVYVLGPPTDPTLMQKLNPGKGEAVHSLNTLSQLSNLDTSSKLMSDALDAVSQNLHSSSQKTNFPFNKKFSQTVNTINTITTLQQSYLGKTWRRIDYDWLSELGRVSLHMDSLTNNSSLVLAFELVESKKILLFVGDAQIGNWKSWFDVEFKDSDVTARDLLSRTVLYKAGHHSSHNATLAEGLELMNEKELVIMIPVNEKVSSKMGFAMLKAGMLAGYNRKSKGRVLRCDTVFHNPDTGNKYKFDFAKKPTDFVSPIKQVSDASKKSHLFIEYQVK